MYNGKLVFSQIMAHLLLSPFHRCVAAHRCEHKILDFSCLDQFLAMVIPSEVGGGRSGRLRGECKSLHRRDATDPHIGAFVVVCPEPARRGLLEIRDGIEEILREPIVAYGAIEPFDVGILLWLARLNKLEVNAALFHPSRERETHVLR